MQSPVRTAAAGLVGNILEWFDYGVYGAFSTEIGQHFTPAHLPDSDKQLFANAVFWLGFAARPIGGLILGMVGDRIGRRALLTLSIILMGSATLGIGLVPGYATIGVAAPVLLVVLRVIQGFSLGGEFTGSMVYTTELASPKWRGIIASSTAAGTTLGLFLGRFSAWLVVGILGREVAGEWGWRIPFIASVLLCVGGWLLRHGIDEPEQGKKAVAQRAPIVRSLLNDWKPIAQTFGIAALTNVSYYLLFQFNPEARKAESNDFQLATMLSLVVVLAAKVFGGWLSDHVGRRRMMIALTVVMMALMYWSQTATAYGNWIEFMGGQLLVGIPLAMALGLQGAMVVEIFPLRTRVTSMSFAYSVTLALSGGIAPVVATWLMREFHSPAALTVFALLYGLIGLPIMLGMRETNTRSLDD